jgi:hypothetical protein
MSEQLCDVVRRWLQDGAAEMVPAPELAQHIAGCATCRGLLAISAAAVLQVPVPDDAIACDDCQDLLDAYVDCERRRGGAAAARRYPHVWWHLFTCPDCADVYRLIGALLNAEHAGNLAPLSAPVRRPSTRMRLPALCLPRAFLHSVFAPYARLGAAMGEDGDELIFAEEQRAEHQIVVSVRPSQAALWEIVVAVTPALAGRAVITCGEARFIALFDAHGQAIAAGVPPALLTDQAGADLLIAIEHDDAAS